MEDVTLRGIRLKGEKSVSHKVCARLPRNIMFIGVIRPLLNVFLILLLIVWSQKRSDRTVNDMH